MRGWLRNVLASGGSIGVVLAANQGLAQPAPAPPGPAAGVAAQASAPTNVGTVSTGEGAGGAVRANNTATPRANGTQAQAYALKKAVINEIEVQPQSVIQQLPDVNVAEALSRVPGISVETDTGEGRFINVRGLNADLNSVTWDGVRLQPTNLSSVQGGQRAIALDAIPSYVVGGVELIETLRPEDDAESLGGLVNLVPRSLPANGDPALDLTGGLGEETLRGTQVVDYGAFVGGSFGIDPGTGPFDHPGSRAGWVSNAKPFSIYFFDAQHNDDRGIDDIEPGYSDQQAAGAPDKLLSGIDLRYYHNDRRRWGRGGGFGFKPNAENEWYFRYVESGYTEHTGKDFLTFTGLDSGFTPGATLPDGAQAPGTQLYDPNNPKNYLAPSAVANRTSTDGQETVTDRVLSWGGRNVVFDTVKLDYHGAYSEGLDNFPYSYGSVFSTNPFPLSYHYNGQVQGFRYQPLNGLDLLDPNNYTLTSLSTGGSFNRDTEWSGAMNAEIPYTLFDADQYLKAGGILRLRDRVETADNLTFGIPAAAPTLSGFVGGSNIDFYNNTFDIGQPINEIAIKQLAQNPAYSEAPNALSDQQANELGTASATENVYAAYIEDGGKSGKLSWLFGVRMEQTFGVYHANLSIANADGSTTIEPDTFKHAYVDYFPSVQLQYNATPNLVARAIYSTGLARPGFNQISPAVTIDPVNLIVSTGNPHLGATYGNNFDLGAEYYLPDGGIVSLYGFDKEFTDYILPRITFGLYDNPQVAGQRVQIDTFDPSGHSRVYGVEGIYTQHFTFLPHPFDGLGLDTNFTYNQSEVPFSFGPGQATQSLELPETSPWNANESLTYDANQTTFRFTISYVSKNIYGLGGTKATDVYLQGRVTADLGIAYNVTPHAQLYFDAKNLLDTPLKYTETASSDRPIQREFYGPDIIGGFRAHF